MRPVRIFVRVLLVAAAIAAVVLLSTTAVAVFAPALVLFALLWHGTYPGADRFERIVRAVRARRPRTSVALPAACRRPRRRRARGGLLIAFAMAVRPPPASALA